MEDNEAALTERPERETIWVVRKGGHPGPCITLPRYLTQIPGLERALLDTVEIARGRSPVGGKVAGEWGAFHDSVTAILASEAKRSA